MSKDWIKDLTAEVTVDTSVAEQHVEVLQKIRNELEEFGDSFLEKFDAACIKHIIPTVKYEVNF